MIIIAFLNPRANGGRLADVFRDRYSGRVNISSFHSHTRLCKHASGVPVDYVRRAVADGGCSALGISDHAPYPDDSVWPESRMKVAQIPEYVSMVREAKGIAPFPFYWGFECEWYPAYDSWYRDFLRGEIGAEFLVYGSHWVNDNGEFWYIPDISDKRLFSRYIDLTVGGIRSGNYDFIAHPDLFLGGFVRMDDDVKAGCRSIIAAAIDAGLPLEINGLGLRRPKLKGDNGMRSPYPVREFWEMAADAGATIICNSDAHAVEHVLASARNAWAFAEEIGITPVDTVEALKFTKKANRA